MNILIDDPQQPPIATVILGHGSIMPMDAPFLEQIAGLLSKQGIRVIRFEFPYMERARKYGGEYHLDPEHVLLETWRQVIQTIPERTGDIFIGGKCMGGRTASLIADEMKVAGVLALTFPFHLPRQPVYPPRKAARLCAQHLGSLKTPMLVIQGEWDPSGLPRTVEKYSLSKAVSIHWIPKAKHSLEPTLKSKATFPDNLRQASASMVGFIRRVVLDRARISAPETDRR